MTETLQDRLRHGAKNIHSIGAGRAADLLKVAADALDQTITSPGPRLIANLPPPGPLTCDCSKDPNGRVQVCVHLRARLEELGGEDPLVIRLREVTGKYDALVPAAEHLRKAVMDEIAINEREKSERRAFLERAVCHPGPPLSEHENYDPEAPIGELEAAVLERMDLELKAERELWDIRKLCEEALGRTPDPARSTMQVVRDLCADHSAARTYRANMEDPPAGLEPHETTRRMIDEFATYPGRDEEGRLLPTVRPEHFAGPFPTISGYVKRTQEARAATIDQALRMLKSGQSLAVHDEPERVDILFLDPGQYPPLGQTWTVYGPLALDDQLAGATGSEIRQDAVAEHIRAHGGDPAAATVVQIADALNAVDPNATYKPNAAGDGLDWSPVQRAGVGGTIRIVGGDPGALASLGLPDPEPLRPAVAAGMATLRANSADRSPGPLPKPEEWQKLIDGLRGKHEGALNSPETRARIQGDIAGFMASIKDAPPKPSVVASDLQNGKVAFKVRVAPELAAAVERQRDEGYEPERCMSCGGDGYFHGPGLGDEPCPECDGAGRR